MVDGGVASMTRTTSTQGQISRGELKHIIDVLLLVCQLLKALQPILERAEKHAPGPP